jgi:hypothetical protein
MTTITQTYQSLHAIMANLPLHLLLSFPSLSTTITIPTPLFPITITLNLKCSPKPPTTRKTKKTYIPLPCYTDSDTFFVRKPHLQCDIRYKNGVQLAVRKRRYLPTPPLSEEEALSSPPSPLNPLQHPQHPKLLPTDQPNPSTNFQNPHFPTTAISGCATPPDSDSETDRFLNEIDEAFQRSPDTPFLSSQHHSNPPTQTTPFTTQTDKTPPPNPYDAVEEAFDNGDLSEDSYFREIETLDNSYFREIETRDNRPITPPTPTYQSPNHSPNQKTFTSPHSDPLTNRPDYNPQTPPTPPSPPLSAHFMYLLSLRNSKKKKNKNKKARSKKSNRPSLPTLPPSSKAIKKNPSLNESPRSPSPDSPGEDHQSPLSQIESELMKGTISTSEYDDLLLLAHKIPPEAPKGPKLIFPISSPDHSLYSDDSSSTDPSSPPRRGKSPPSPSPIKLPLPKTRPNPGPTLTFKTVAPTGPFLYPP